MPAVRCPHCKTRYKVPQHASGRRMTCKRCERVFRLPEFKTPDESVDPDELLHFADDLSAGERVASMPPPPTDVPEAVLPEVSHAAPVEVGYAPGQEEQLEPGAAARRYAGFFRSLGHSAAFPVRLGDCVTFIIMSVILLAGSMAYFAGCLGWAAQVIVAGWFCSFQFNIVLGAAAGESELPPLALTGGLWEDIVAPLLKILSTYAVVSIPFVVYILAGMLGAPAAGGAGGGGGAPVWLTGQYLIGTVFTVAAGLFMWPIVVLVVAIGGVGGLFRPDLIAQTIIRTLPAYLITVLTVYLAMGLNIVAEVVAESVDPDPDHVPQWLATMILLPLLLKFVAVYLTIIAMRTIGLYYHHFKTRFAWDWG